MKIIRVDFHADLDQFEFILPVCKTCYFFKALSVFVVILNTYFILKNYLPIEENVFSFGQVKMKYAVTNDLLFFLPS